MWHESSITADVAQVLCHSRCGTSPLSQQMWHESSVTVDVAQVLCYSRCGTSPLSCADPDVAGPIFLIDCQIEAYILLQCFNMNQLIHHLYIPESPSNSDIVQIW